MDNIRTKCLRLLLRSGTLMTRTTLRVSILQWQHVQLRVLQLLGRRRRRLASQEEHHDLRQGLGLVQHQRILLNHRHRWVMDLRRRPKRMLHRRRLQHVVVLLLQILHMVWRIFLAPRQKSLPRFTNTWTRLVQDQDLLANTGSNPTINNMHDLLANVGNSSNRKLTMCLMVPRLLCNIRGMCN